MHGTTISTPPEATRGSLALHHQRMLAEESGLAATVMTTRGYFTATEKTELKALGFSEVQCRVPTLVIPLWGVRGDQASYQIRPDTPRHNAKGKAIKYETPGGTTMMLDVHPHMQPALGDPALPLFITEGVKKGDCLVSRGRCAVALNGVYSWRGKNLYNGLTVLADWEYIALKGRTVYLVFDNDVMVKPEVNQALVRLARFLTHRGATVRYIYLPEGPGKIGVDDYLARGHTLDELVQLARATPPAFPKETHVQTLLRIGERTELLKTAEGQRYARVAVHGHHEVLEIGERGSGFRAWLLQQFRVETGNTPSMTALTQAVEAFGAEARFDAPVCEVHTRLAYHEGKLYLDLANDAWEVVEIDATGWQVVSNPPVYFQRPPGMLPLPCPAKTGTLEGLYLFFNVPVESDEALLIVSWLLGCLMPHGAYPHLCIHGEQGTAKTTLTRILRTTIDPNKAPSRSAPKEERDLAITAKHARIVALENISHLPDWLSDALCSLATGAGLSTRKLYSDADETIFASQRPVILNGITEVAVRGDLIDRCIFVTLQPIPEEQRKSERDLWTAFETTHPQILSALLTAASTALRTWHTTKIAKLPRMADFALWVESAAPALGWKPGEFLAAYQRNRNVAVSVELESSPVASVLLTYLESHRDVEILMGELLTALTEIVTGAGAKPPPQTWPKSAQALGGALKRLAPALRAQGIRLTRHAHTERGTPISITKDLPPPDEVRDAAIQFVSPEESSSASSSVCHPIKQQTLVENRPTSDEADELFLQCSVRKSKPESAQEDSQNSKREKQESSSASSALSTWPITPNGVTSASPSLAIGVALPAVCPQCRSQQWQERLTYRLCAHCGYKAGQTPAEIRAQGPTGSQS